MIPINVDVNASRRDYDEAVRNNSVLVHSSFYTFQGEGPFAGQPALFVRLAGCNIGLKQDCPWCDTKFDLRDGKQTDALELIQMIAAHYRRAQLVVVTGGEPLLQWEMMEYIIRLVSPVYPDLEWQFETNGMLLRDTMIEPIKNGPIHMVVSPKVPHNMQHYRPLPAMFHQHNPVLAERLSLKYVVCADAGSPYHDLPADAHTAALAGFRVYVSGMTAYKRAPLFGEVPSVWNDSLVDRQATAANYMHAARLALAHGFNVSYQSHLLGAVQ